MAVFLRNEIFIKPWSVAWDCLTVSGKTVAENLAGALILTLKNKTSSIRLRIDQINSHLQILYGNLAEGGSVAKITGKEGERFEGTARVFEGEKHLIEVCSPDAYTPAMWW
jgi:dihydroxy-acid dehydratase